jgi:hypothetical protein
LLGSLPDTTTENANWAEEIIRRFEEKLDSVDNRQNQITSESNKYCIQLGGFDMDGLPKAVSWLADNVMDHVFGLILGSQKPASR